jgi:hypothetical protein
LRDERCAAGIGSSHSASGLPSASIAAMLFGPPPPALKKFASISVMRPSCTRSRSAISSNPPRSRIVPIHPACCVTGSAK